MVCILNRLHIMTKRKIECEIIIIGVREGERERASKG